MPCCLSLLYFWIALCAISGWMIFSPTKFFADFLKKDKILTSISFFSQSYLMTVADQKTFQCLDQFLPAITICVIAIIFVYFIREYHNNKKKRNFNELQICMGLMFVAICMTMTNSGRLPIQLGIYATVCLLCCLPYLCIGLNATTDLGALLLMKRIRQKNQIIPTNHHCKTSHYGYPPPRR